jgi:N-acetyltransferase
MNVVTLEGRRVRLEPLSLDHVAGLAEVGLVPELWQQTMTSIATREDMESYVRTAMQWHERGTALPFATVLRSENRVIGSTRFANYEAPHRRVEIGWTWLAPQWQRTGANVEAKLLMMAHAFEVLGLNRVEFKTDVLNSKSRNALLGIGATEEGVFRKHQVLWNGRIRDSVYFSVINDEWPAVRARLEQRLERSQ